MARFRTAAAVAAEASGELNADDQLVVDVCGAAKTADLTHGQSVTVFVQREGLESLAREALGGAGDVRIDSKQPVAALYRINGAQ
jgi:hypothetical protein